MQISKTPLNSEVFQAGNFRTLDMLVFCKERHWGVGRCVRQFARTNCV